jgi:predicted ATPase
VYGRFVFEHALIRQTLYERLTHTRRARLHLRVAEALEDQSTDDASRLAELAHHFVHAPPSQGRAKAAHYAELAARHALDVLAFEDAVRHYDMALSLLVVGPVSCLSHAASTLPVHVQANGRAVRL